jgi:hypothetical protein
MKQLVGHLREKVPKLSDGTIGTDVPRLVKSFGKGMFVDVLKMKPTLGKKRAEKFLNFTVSKGHFKSFYRHSR